MCHLEMLVRPWVVRNPWAFSCSRPQQQPLGSDCAPNGVSGKVLASIISRGSHDRAFLSLEKVL